MFSKTDCCRIIGHTACMTDKEALLTEFSQRFRRLMNEKGWASDRRDDVGKRLGGSGSAVTYWWNGNRLPTMNQAIVIAFEMGRGSMRPQPCDSDRLDISKLPIAETTKKCPACAELIKKEAQVCRFCGLKQD